MVTRHSLACLATTGARLLAQMVTERDVISTAVVRWTIAALATAAHITQESHLSTGIIIQKGAATSVTTVDRTERKIITKRS